MSKHQKRFNRIKAHKKLLCLIVITEGQLPHISSFSKDEKRRALEYVIKKNFDIKINEKDKNTLFRFLGCGFYSEKITDTELYILCEFLRNMPKNIKEYKKAKSINEVPNFLKNLFKPLFREEL